MDNHHSIPTILVTGGAGFIGSALCRHLVGNGIARVVNIDKLTYAGNLENLKDVEKASNYVFEKADITDKEAIEKIFAKYSIDGVIHLAAESHVDRSILGLTREDPETVASALDSLRERLAYGEDPDLYDRGDNSEAEDEESDEEEDEESDDE